MVQLFGPEDAGYLLHLTGKLIGMQYFDEIARGFGAGRGAAMDFAVFLHALFEAQDDVAEIERVRRRVRNQAADLEADGRCRRLSPGLRQGAAKACSRALLPAAAVIFPCAMRPAAGGEPPFVWSIG